MKSSFCIDLQRFMLIPTKFPLTPEFAKDTDTSNKAIFKQALLETVVEVGGQVLSGLFKGKK